MFYQYLTTNLRDKCSTGAIGGWQHFTKTGWDFINWRPRVEYPIVDLRVFKVLAQRHEAETSLILELPKITELTQSKRYKWTQPESIDECGILVVWHGRHILKDNDRAGHVKFFQLPWKAQFEWFKYLWKHPRHKPMVARASWANMLVCLGVAPQKPRDLKRQRADIIPAGMDNPLQSTSLGDIMVWCFLLGMKNVDYNDSNATITARGKYAALRTLNQNIPGITNVISLEGDLDGLRRSVIQASTPELYRLMYMARGWVDFVTRTISIRNFRPLEIVNSLKGNGVVYDNPFETITVGNLIWEANIKIELDERSGSHPSTVSEWAEFWQWAGVGACPSILQTLAFLPYQSICGCFPLRLCLSPYSKHVSLMSVDWWLKEGKNICEVEPDHKDYALRGKDPAPFLNKFSSFLLVSGEIPAHYGSRSWIFHSCHKKLRNWNSDRFEIITKLSDARNGEFSSKFPILSIVDRKLGGGSSNGSLQMFRGGRRVTLEAAIWFTLFTLEGRIEALWDEIVSDGEPVTINSKKSSHHSSGDVLDLFQYHISAHPNHFDSLLASFLALWISVLQKVDLFSERCVMHECFDQVLKDWKDKDDLCVSTYKNLDKLVSLMFGLHLTVRTPKCQSMMLEVKKDSVYG